jgi:hypothetical protein
MLRSMLGDLAPASENPGQIIGRTVRWIYSHHPSAEHFQQCAEFLPLGNPELGPLAVAVLSVRSPQGPPLPLAPPCNRQRPFFVAGDRQGFPLLVRAPH